MHLVTPRMRGVTGMTARPPRPETGGSDHCGTPYRIRTDGLRLERAVSWATRRTGPEGPGSYQRPESALSDLVRRSHAEGAQGISERRSRRGDQLAPETPRPRVLLADDRRGVLVEVAEGRRQTKRIRGQQRRREGERSLGERAGVRLDAVEELALRRVQLRGHLDGRAVIGDLPQDTGSASVRVLQVHAGIAGHAQRLV